MLKISPKNDQIKLPFWFKFLYTIVAIALTVMLAGAALERILYSLMNPPSGDLSEIEEAAKQATMIVFCGSATAIIRLLASPFPQGGIRLCSVMAIALLTAGLLVHVSAQLAANNVPISTIACSLGLLACTVAEDVYVINEKRKVARKNQQSKKRSRQSNENRATYDEHHPQQKI